MNPLHRIAQTTAAHARRVRTRSSKLYRTFVRIFTRTRASPSKADAPAFTWCKRATSISDSLDILGLYDEALQLYELANAVLFRLFQHDVDFYKPHLAKSLYDLSRLLGAMGRTEEALDCSWGSVQLCRELTERDPKAFTHCLAHSLTELSHHLRYVGRRDEALDRIHEASMLFRALARQDPIAFTRSLVGSLYSLYVCLCETGRRYEALRILKECVQLRRKLADRDPDVSYSYMHLAPLLWTLSMHWSEFGENEKALTAIQESSDLYEKLAEKFPDVYAKEFANVLDALYRCLITARRVSEARLAAKRADEVRGKVKERAFRLGVSS